MLPTKYKLPRETKVFNFDELQNELKIIVLRWTSFLTFIALSCTNKNMRSIALSEAENLFNTMSKLSSTWDIFIIGAPTIYKFGRILGRRPKIPYLFIQHIYEELREFMGAPTRIDAAALELIYFMLSASLEQNPQYFEIKLQKFMPSILAYTNNAHDDEVKLEDVEHAIDLRSREKTTAIPEQYGGRIGPDSAISDAYRRLVTRSDRSTESNDAAASAAPSLEPDNIDLYSPPRHFLRRHKRKLDVVTTCGVRINQTWYAHPSEFFQTVTLHDFEVDYMRDYLGRKKNDYDESYCKWSKSSQRERADAGILNICWRCVGLHKLVDDCLGFQPLPIGAAPQVARLGQARADAVTKKLNKIMVSNAWRLCEYRKKRRIYITDQFNKWRTNGLKNPIAVLQASDANVEWFSEPCSRHEP